jgi:phosphonate transport system substrate-binding protein
MIMMAINRASAWALFWVLGTTPLLAGDKPITIALTPDGRSQTERMPLQKYLAQKMGHEVKLTTPSSYADVMDGLSSGAIDFACLGALTYVRAHAKIGVVPLVQRPNDLQFHTLFIAGAATSIRSLSDLKGKRFAYGDINSASAHLIPYLELKRAGLDPAKDFSFRYSGGHPLTIKLVETGVVDAGAVDESIFDSMIRDGKADRRKVRVFYTSRPFVDYVFVARRDIPESDRQKFAGILLGLRESKDGEVLKILRASKFIRAKDEEYANIRAVARDLNMLQ